MYIGEIARMTDASPKAIRHYEALGLLGRISRAGSYRVYSENDVRQVRLIRRAQALGFRLSELRGILDGDGRDPDWHGLAARIELKRGSIQVEIQRLRSLDAHLVQIGAEIHSCLDGEARTGLVVDHCSSSLGMKPHCA